MDFKKIGIEDRDTIIKYLDNENRKLCMYCFTDIFIWNDVYSTEFCIKDDILYIRQYMEDLEDKVYYYYVPMPSKKYLIKGIENIIVDSVYNNYKFYIGGASLENLASLGRAFPRTFHAKNHREYADYIYLSQELINLSGRKFHKKKNLVNKFKKEYVSRWEYKDIKLFNKEDIIEFNDKWVDLNPDKNSTDIEEERCAIMHALSHMDTLNIDGGVLLVDNEIIAYTLATKVRDDMYVVHIEKALADYVGAYQMINNQFVVNNAQDVKYINREDDVGIEGLRKAKMSYNPIIIEDYYELKLKNTLDRIQIIKYNDKMYI